MKSWKVTPKDGHALIHETCDHTTLHNKRDFAQVINLRIGKREDFPGLNEWGKCGHRVLIRVRQKVTAGGGELMVETEVGVTQRRDHLPKHVGGLRAGQGTRLPWSLQKQHSSSSTLMSRLPTSQLQNDTVVLSYFVEICFRSNRKLAYYLVKCTFPSACS